ncbi:MAG: helix-turn-helix domain-containing protein [Sphaerochaetaceae bacterium]|nr:helix-turn-helix domain-containing protein [Sphaerochaetaceae bacterium]
MSHNCVQEYPSYYTVIPSYIRYHPKLSYFEIVLYSEIVALSNKYGYSFASNSYFAKVFNKSTKTISRSINKMIQLKLLRVEIDKEGGNKRKLYISLYENNDILYKLNESTMDKNVNTPIDKNVNNTLDKNVEYPIDKNVQHNIIKEPSIIKNNNINNNMSIPAKSCHNTPFNYQPLNPFFRKRNYKIMNSKKNSKKDVQVEWLDKYVNDMGINLNEDVQVEWLKDYL